MDKITVKNICDFLKSRDIEYRLSSDSPVTITGFCPLNNLKDHSVTWVRSNHKLPIEELNSYTNVLLFAESGIDVGNALFPVIFVKEVQRIFFRVTERFFGELNPEKKVERIEPSAIVETSSIGSGVYVGHHSYISEQAAIGNNVTIMHNVTIDGKIEIGDNCFIESGTVIGACGFGYMANEEGNQEIVPHYAGVRIGKNVRIGANCTIIRGCLADTVIEDDVKIADLVCISHNDIIKKGAMITCGTVIAGSTTVGERVWMAPGVVVSNGVEIGDDAYVGIGSVVPARIRKGKKVFGNPAKYI